MAAQEPWSKNLDQQLVLVAAGSKKLEQQLVLVAAGPPASVPGAAIEGSVELGMHPTSSPGSAAAAAYIAASAAPASADTFAAIPALQLLFLDPYMLQLDLARWQWRQCLQLDCRAQLAWTLVAAALEAAHLVQ